MSYKHFQLKAAVHQSLAAVTRATKFCTLAPGIFFIIAAFFSSLHTEMMGRDMSVGTASRYRLDCPGIEVQWGEKIFRTHPDVPLLSLFVFIAGYMANSYLCLLHTEMYISSHAPSTKRQIRENFTSSLEKCGPHYGTWFKSRFWRLEFGRRVLDMWKICAPLT